MSTLGLAGQVTLDAEAYQRGNSVYFPEFVVPMLPEVLSNGLCSLNPQVDRLCMVCEMTISAAGRMSGYKFYEAVMNSHARLTYTKVAAILGVSEVGKATADDVRAATSFAIGGVAPLGHPAPIRTLVDVDLGQYDEVWAAGGHPHYVFPTTFDELVRITGGTPADVGA